MIQFLRSFLSPAAIPAAIGAMLLAPATAQTVNYTGVGGRHEQSRYFIQRNVPLASSGTEVTIPHAGSNRRIFVRFLTDNSTDPVTGFDIHMKFNFLGEVVPAWIYTADAQNAPGSAVLTGQIGIGLGMHYCRASFPTSYTLQPNRLYFMAFQLPAGEALTFATSSGGGTQVTYFVTPNGAPQQARLQYGVHRGGYSPAITLEQPRIGHPYNVDLSGASVGQPASLWFQLIVPGRARDLYSFGAPGSVLNLDLHNTLFAAVAGPEPDRTRRVTLFMPYVPQLVGLPLHFQWSANTSDSGIPAGWVTSDAAGCVIL